MVEEIAFGLEMLTAQTQSSLNDHLLIASIDTKVLIVAGNAYTMGAYIEGEEPRVAVSVRHLERSGWRATCQTTN